MKKLPVKRFLSGFFFAFAITVGAVFCPITAFDIYVEPLTLVCAIGALTLAFSLPLALPRGWIGLCAVFAALALLLWKEFETCLGGFLLCAEAVVPVFSEAFSLDKAFVLPEGMRFAASANAFFLIPAGVISFFCAWALEKRHSPTLCFVVGLPPLVFCLIILETVPAAWAVALLFGALALLLLTQSVRAADEGAGTRMSAVLALPLALLIALLCLIVPPEQYERPEWSTRAQSGVQAFAEQLSLLRRNEKTGEVTFVSPFTPGTLGSWSWDTSVSRVELARVGPQKETGRHVMAVYAPVNGVYHLRASSLGLYEDSTWRAIPDEVFSDITSTEETFLNTRANGSQTLRVSIRTDMKASVCYLPYRPVALPENTQAHTDAYVENRLQSTEYTIEYTPGENAREASEEYRALVYAQYTQLPDDLRQALSALLPTQWETEDAAACAARVSAFVREGKRYSLDTARMPSDAEDFALWFLTESETGYCVHFATAAAVLLRYYGVPARYVTGYYVSAKSGQWVDVTEDAAHAWVEYFDGTQWRVLDPTPSAFRESTESTPESDPVSEQETEKSPQNSPQAPEETQKTPSNEPSSDATPSTSSPQSVDNTAKPEGEKGKAGKWLSVVLGLLALVGVAFGWRVFRLSRRRAQLSHGQTNRRAVYYFRHIRQLAALVDASVPEELEALALKARFSQHRLTPEELAPFEKCSEELTEKLMRERSVLRRFVYRMVYVLY